jgi:hypothetical protein
VALRASSKQIDFHVALASTAAHPLATVSRSASISTSAIRLVSMAYSEEGAFERLLDRLILMVGYILGYAK